MDRGMRYSGKVASERLTKTHSVASAHRGCGDTLIAFGVMVLQIITLLVFLTIPAPKAEAQMLGIGGGPATNAAAAPADPFGRDTPRGLVTGLLSALSAQDDARLLQYFETRPPGVITARHALDQGTQFVSSAELSLVPAGHLNDGLDAGLERVGRLLSDGGEVPLRARRVQQGESEIWLLSSESVAALSAWTPNTAGLVSETRALTELLPEGPAILGVSVRDYGLIAGFVTLSYLLAFLLLRGRMLVGRKVPAARKPGRWSHFISASEPPLRLIIAAGIFSLGIELFGLSAIARHQLISFVQIVFWFAGMWFSWRLIDAVAGATLERMSRRGAITAFSAVTLVSRVVKVIVGGIFAAFALRAFGVDITAGLAALGIGGLAFAFGAQKLVENLIGSVTLIADRPVRVGDFCKFGDTLGTVEEIGIRSTKVRTLARTIVTVPNGEFSSLHLENFTRRDIFHFHHTVGVRYETTPDQMRELLWRLRQMLLDNASVDADPARVRFINFAAYSLDVEIFAYVHADDWNGFLEVQEALMLDCMDIVEQCRTGFAFPSQTLYLGRDAQSVDEERKAA